MDEVEKRGLQVIMQEAIQRVTKKTTGFGISIDIDAICPEAAPGVNTPEKNGLHVNDLLESLAFITKNPHFIGAEIVEFNPKNDKQHKTEKVVIKLINALMPL